jgi:glutamyl-tRNA synthetase
MEELIEKFSISGLSKSSAIFDEAKMKWLNGEYIKELYFDKFMKLATPFFDQSDIKGKYSYEKLGKLVQSRVEILSEIPEKVNFLANYDKFDLELFNNKKFKIDASVAKNVLVESLPELEALTEWTEEKLHEVTVKIATKLEAKSGQIYTVHRIALSGVSVTPGGSVELADILGKEQSLERINKCLGWLE